MSPSDRFLCITVDVVWNGTRKLTVESWSPLSSVHGLEDEESANLRLQSFNLEGAITASSGNCLLRNFETWNASYVVSMYGTKITKEQQSKRQHLYVYLLRKRCSIMQLASRLFTILAARKELRLT